MRAFLYIKEIWRGKDLYRIFMNLECAKHALYGSIVDIGGGEGKASYNRFFQKKGGAEIFVLDRKNSSIDFERDPLPYSDASVDVLLVLNVLEHVYNYSFLLSEMRRVLKPGGQVYGAVPFLVGCHPDPKDYWRYTSLALKVIFITAGFSGIEIKVLGRGPFTAAFSQIEFIIPRFIKIIVPPFLFFIDSLFLKLKPGINIEKSALGLFFSLTKS